MRIYQRNSSTNAWEQLGADIDAEAPADESGYSVSLLLTAHRRHWRPYSDGTATMPAMCASISATAQPMPGSNSALTSMEKLLAMNPDTASHSLLTAVPSPLVPIATTAMATMPAMCIYRLTYTNDARWWRCHTTSLSLRTGSDCRRRLRCSYTDNLTGDSTPTFTGTAEAGTTVELFADSSSLGTTITDSEGN